MLLGIGVMTAIRQAVNSAKADTGFDLKKWYNLGETLDLQTILLKHCCLM